MRNEMSAAGVRLRFRGPEDVVFVPGVGEVLFGADITVSAELAGRATVEHDDQPHDIGHGLLAQTFTDPETGGVVASWIATPAPKTAVSSTVKGA
jgi:hypothetical protein